MLCPGNELLLESLAEVTEIVTVPRYAYDETAILLRVLLGSTQDGSIHYVELNVVPVKFEVRAHQLDKFIQSLVIGQHLGRELLIEERSARAGVIHFSD